MINISSAFTLVFKLFLPLFWIVFFGSWYLVLLFADGMKGSILNQYDFKLYFGIFMVSWMLFLYFTVWKLQRIDADKESLIVTNFFKAYRYKVENIAKVTNTNYLFFTVKTFHFKEKGYYGKKVSVMVSKKRWSIYKEEVLDSLNIEC